jgi:trigger factor
MKTSVTELPESRVRVEVEVDPADVDRRVDRAARDLGQQLRVPGFRKGKVPARIVVQRVGRGAVLEQALRDALPEWYERALLEAGVSPVGDPKLDVSELPEDGEPLRFVVEVGVRPKAKLGEHRGLEVGRAEPEVPDEAIAAELDRLREGFARLEPVEREARDGDTLVIDYRGEIDGEPFEGGEARDRPVELGADSLLDEFEAGLAGASAGDEREVEVNFPDDYGSEDLAGRSARFAVTIREVREKQLPELDDDFAADASEFDTLEELREDIAAKLRHAIEHRIEDEFREAAVDAAVNEADVSVPEGIVQARAEESWARLERSLEQRGISPDRYLQMQGKSRQQVIEEARPDAELALKREAVLEAVADAEAIEVSDEELLDSLRSAAEREGTQPQKLLDRIRASGRDAALREDLRMRKAVDLLSESATPIPVDQAKAREQLWTPEKEHSESSSPELWTPGER